MVAVMVKRFQIEAWREIARVHNFDDLTDDLPYRIKTLCAMVDAADGIVNGFGVATSNDIDCTYYLRLYALLDQNPGAL